MVNDDMVLVAMVNNKRDLHIANSQRWYRIPVKSAPGQLEDMKYIAFYQTSAFDEQKWSVIYWAEIRNIKIVKRLELLPHENDHPKADEQYYRIEIGKMKRLPEPIVSNKGQRAPFISTTLEKFRAAKELSDLKLSKEGETSDETRNNSL